MRDRTVRTSSLTPAYQWDERSQRYVNAVSKKFVSRDTVRQALDIALDRSRNEVTRLSRALVNGQINLATWQTSIASEIKSMHLASASLAKGGWAQMTQSDFGRTGQIVRQEYGHLARFAQDIKEGRQLLDGSLLRRANMYALSPTGTYEEVARRNMLSSGKLEEKRVLGGADHCADCVRLADGEWHPIGSLPRIGQSVCMTNCRCRFVYR